MSYLQPDLPPVPKKRSKKRLFLAGLLGVGLTVLTLFAASGTLVSAFSNIKNTVKFPSQEIGGLLASVGSSLGNVTGGAGTSLSLLGDAQVFLALLPDLLDGKGGDAFIEQLHILEEKLIGLSKTGDGASLLSLVGSSDDLRVLGATAGLFGDWLEDKEERHIAVLFGNTAEMRPGGGFIGSYAEITLEKGALTDITVRDINESDRLLAQDFIPPVPLEPITDRWRAAEGNWFLDGPTSGAVVLDLMNRSRLQTNPERKLDGVAMLSAPLVAELLKTTGPIALNNGIKVTAENFLTVIQGEVQEGLARKNEHPKAVLGELTPRLLDKLRVLSRENPTVLLSPLVNGLYSRDLYLYVADAELQKQLVSLGIGGALYPLSDTFQGGYVAVAPSTIGADKTDAVVAQQIVIKEELTPGGQVETNVSITREHKGNDRSEWWYREDHRSYVKLYAPLLSEVVRTSGLWKRDRDNARYDSNFAVHPLFKKIMESRVISTLFPGLAISEESNRLVFGFWQKTPLGQKNTASVTYTRQVVRDWRDKGSYTFVLERQPGATSNYRIELTAPSGFVWAESGTRLYRATLTEVPGQQLIPLTLQKNN